jgi:hypothetical protein
MIQVRAHYTIFSCKRTGHKHLELAELFAIDGQQNALISKILRKNWHYRSLYFGQSNHKSNSNK